MPKNTQEYLNGLINKPKMFYLDLSNSTKTSTCSNCHKKSWSETTPNLVGEIENLSEFNSLRGLNASNNKFTTLNGLFTLPNKNQVEKLNFFGNKVGGVDLARLFTEFPNLKYLNLDYNPLSAKNLENLSSEQLNKLADGLKSKQIRISVNQGAILSDLLEYTRELIKKGENKENAHKLQAILQSSSVKEKQEPNNSQTPLLIGGGVVVVGLALVMGYLVGKRGKVVSE